MVAVLDPEDEQRERLVAELTESALTVMARHGTRGTSLGLELRLWKALTRALHELSRARKSGGPTVLSWDDWLAWLTRVAYEVALDSGVAGSFLDLEMDLWRSLRQVIRRYRFIPSQSETAAPPDSTGQKLPVACLAQRPQ